MFYILSDNGRPFINLGYLIKTCGQRIHKDLCVSEATTFRIDLIKILSPSYKFSKNSPWLSLLTGDDASFSVATSCKKTKENWWNVSSPFVIYVTSVCTWSRVQSACSNYHRESRETVRHWCKTSRWSLVITLTYQQPLRLINAQMSLSITLFHSPSCFNNTWT